VYIIHDIHCDVVLRALIANIGHSSALEGVTPLVEPLDTASVWQRGKDVHSLGHLPDPITRVGFITCRRCGTRSFPDSAAWLNSDMTLALVMVSRACECNLLDREAWVVAIPPPK